jgi:hypothetical protein
MKEKSLIDVKYVAQAFFEVKIGQTYLNFLATDFLLKAP